MTSPWHCGSLSRWVWEGTQHIFFSPHTHTHKGLSTELAGDVRKAAGAHVGTDLGELAHLSNRHEPKQLKLAAFGASASNKKLLVTTI